MEITEKKLKSIFKEQREEYQEHVDKSLKEQIEEYQRYLGVLKENFDSKVQMIIEQYDSIIQRLDAHDARLVAVEKNIEIMKVDISFIKGSLKQKVDVEDFSALEKRVILLEAKISRK